MKEMLPPNGHAKTAADVIAEIKANNAHLDPDELQAVIDSAVQDVRKAWSRLSAEEWEAFQTELNAPPRPLPRLERLLKEKSVFE